MYDLSVSVVAYNEEENLEGTVEALIKVLKEACRNYEVIIVESGSTDKTGEIADKLAKRYKNIRVIHQGAKKGYGNAIREGFSKSRYNLLFYLDADSPFDISELKKALPLTKDTDAVIGYKIGKRESFNRWIYSKGFNILMRLLFGLKVRDVNFSFKIIKKQVFDDLNLKCDGWFIDGEMLIELKDHNYGIREIGINFKPRIKGRSNVRPGLNIVVGFIKEIIEYKKNKKYINRG